jgi:hypothetical protein
MRGLNERTKTLKLITKAQRERMITNYRNNDTTDDNVISLDCKPVVKIIDNRGKIIALLTDIDPDYPNHGFGLTDCGGLELGFFDIESFEEPVDLKAHPLAPHYRRDRHWRADKTLSEYAAIAFDAGRIIA